MKRVLITGGSGQLGSELKQILGDRAIAPNSSDLDVSNQNSVNIIINQRPEIVIHCAALTRVDECELDEEKAYSINVTGTRHVAEACRSLQVPLVYISTDYVFDGLKGSPYVESDTPHPVNVYGRTKLDGELVVAELLPKQHYIVRTGWVFGFGKGAENFVLTVLRLSRKFEFSDEKDSIKMVTTQISNPTSANHLAQAMIRLIDTGVYGLFHLTGSGYCSRYEFAQKIVEYWGSNHIKIEPVLDYSQVAKRPKFTALENTRAGKQNIALPPWQNGLQDYLIRLKKTPHFL